MKNFKTTLATMTLLFALLISMSSCQKTCYITDPNTGAVTGTYEATSCSGTSSQLATNGTGTTSTGTTGTTSNGTLGTLGNPFTSMPAIYSGPYDFYVLTNTQVYKNNPQSMEKVGCDANGNPITDGMGGVATNYGVIEGLAIINGAYYRVPGVITDLNLFGYTGAYASIISGGIIYGGLTYSTRPTGYGCKPASCTKVSAGVFTVPNGTQIFNWELN